MHNKAENEGTTKLYLELYTLLLLNRNVPAHDIQFEVIDLS